MKNAFLSLCLLFSFTHSAYAFESLEGCYETLLIDGVQPVYSSDWERNLSRIEIDLSSSFMSLNRGPMIHFLLVLFTGAQGNWTNYHPFVAFTNRGQWQTDVDQWHYIHDEEILFWQWGQTQRVDHRVELDLHKREGGILEGRAEFHSDIRNMSGNRTFKLRRTACP